MAGTEFLRWNASEYGGITQINLPLELIWQPDIFLYSSVAETLPYLVGEALVYNDGSIIAPEPVVYEIACPIDGTYFPFDEQKCEMKFGSWSYDGTVIDLDIFPTSGQLGNYIESERYILSMISFVAISSVLTGYTMNLHFQSTECERVPDWLRRLVFNHLSKIVFLGPTASTYMNRNSYKRQNISCDVKSEDYDLLARLITHDDGEEEKAQEDHGESNDPTEYEARTLEWKMVAQVLDRLFLVCFIVVYLCLTVGIFMYLSGRNQSHAFH
ncbi:neuronal acetylcholine receptor subunit alpha-5-like [Saccoglossus kowalevskii]